MFSYDNNHVQEVKESIRHYKLQKNNDIPKVIFVSGMWDKDHQVRNFINEEYSGMEVRVDSIYNYFFI